ncbi:iron-sulfur cluster carrier protein ApbC [Lysobacter humi (ex Lee et al. 2017)]
MSSPNVVPNWLAAVVVPGTSIALGATGARLRAVESGGGWAVEVIAGFPVGGDLGPGLEAAIREAGRGAGVEIRALDLRSRIAVHAPQPGTTPLTNVRNLIAVGSGKGGVGKSTVAVGLALALARDGARVGVLDADIYGPSVPMMLGLTGRPDSPDGKSIEPMHAHGIEAMSIGLLVEADTPMIWRGPMATSALTQLLGETRWGDLDYLIVDLPPGTGDIQLTLAQKIPVAGAVVVTTPQDVATLDARKAVRMFEKVQVPIVGLVENMAMHTCENCGHVEHVFGQGGAARLETDYGLPVLGSLPLERRVREAGDAGAPAVVSAPETATARALISTARHLVIELAKRPSVAKPLHVTLSGD